jgi:hypothetical protein
MDGWVVPIRNAELAGGCTEEVQQGRPFFALLAGRERKLGVDME